METTLLKTIPSLLSETIHESLGEICGLLQQKVPHYTWVGFYFMNHRKKQLHLGPYSGKPTDHNIIPFGKGICGQVAVSGETYLAENVEEEDNYIACSVDVRSEIVVPLYVGDGLVAQLDIDSDQVNAFTEADEKFLKEVCSLLARTYGSQLEFENFFPSDH